MPYAGADWLKKSLNAEVSPFGCRVADLIGDLFLGIYHIDDDVLRHPKNWTDLHCIIITVGWKSFATYDGDLLTRLVLLCHDRMIRCELDGVGPRRIRLTFHPRTVRTGGNAYERHPTIEAAIEKHRLHFPKVQNGTGVDCKQA